MATTAHFPPSSIAAPTAASDVRVAIWPIVIVIYATLLPREMRFELSGLSFYVDRIALMLTCPWMLYKLSQGTIRFVIPDWLVLFAGAMLVFSVSEVYGVSRAFSSGGAFAFDAVAGYFLARISFRSPQDIRRALVVTAPGYLIAGIAVMIESVTHHLFVRPAFVAVFGPISYTNGGVDVVLSSLRSEIRWGLLRGYGPWIHPILAGLHLATLLPVYWMSGLRGWPRWFGVAAALTAVFTVSSAAILALGLGVLLVFYDWLTRRVAGLKWSHFFFSTAAAMVFVQFAAGGGLIGFISRYATVDAQTAYFRQIIWEYGTRSVWAHPWFGIGYEGYQRPTWVITQSVDNHWLLWAMRYGLPAATAMFAACLVAVFALGKRATRAAPTDSLFYKGLAMSLSVLILMMWTVTILGGTLTWFTLLLGGCVACAQRSYRSAGFTLR